MHVDAYRVQKRALDPCELNLQVAMSFMIQALGTERGSSGSMASTLRCCAISPTLDITLN